MSSRLVGHVLEHYQASAGELVLAIVLADEAAHSGGNIEVVVPELARLSRQSEKNVRRLLKKMEGSTWLECVERSPGGKGRGSIYRINPEWVRLPLGFHFGAPKPGHNLDKMSRFEGSKPGQNVQVSATTPSLFKAIPPCKSPHNGSAVPSAVEGGVFEAAEDERLAHWMLAKIREIHPGHGVPNWARWQREIRLMRTRDERTHRQIAELFAWANADREPRSGDFCWASVILSPTKLRAQWDKLEIHRKQRQRASTQAEERCAEVLAGTRCQNTGTVRVGSELLCIDCYQARPVV